MAEAELEQLLTPRDVAKALKVSEPCVYAWAQRGVLPSVRVGRAVRFRLSALQRVIESSGRTGGEPQPNGGRPRKKGREV